MHIIYATCLQQWPSPAWSHLARALRLRGTRICEEHRMCVQDRQLIADTDLSVNGPNPTQSSQSRTSQSASVLLVLPVRVFSAFLLESVGRMRRGIIEMTRESSTQGRNSCKTVSICVKPRDQYHRHLIAVHIAHCLDDYGAVIGHHPNVTV